MSHLKNLLKTGVHYSFVGAKKVVSKNPKIKSIIKKSIIPHLNAQNFFTDNYTRWVWNNFLDYTKIPAARAEYEALEYKPLISVIVPTYNTDIEFLKDCFDSVIGQVYENWELCIVDDASPSQEVRDTITEYASKDKRIKYEFLSENVHIARASNKAVENSTGDYLTLFDHDDILWPNALLEVAKALNHDRSIEFIYTDEDKILEDKYVHLGAFFKPDWNPDFLRSVNYITHMTTIKKSVFEKVGGFRKECNGAQDWDLFLRITSSTDKIHHIPKVLYSWRVHELSTAKSTDSKPYVVEAQRKAIVDNIERSGDGPALVEQDKKHLGYWNVSYSVKGNPLISIVIPSKDQYKVIRRCLKSIYEKTTYKNFEVILVDTGSTDERVRSLYEKTKRNHGNFKVVDWPEMPFSYARSCNEGARHAAGELLVMLNNDTEVITPDWLELMAGDAQRSSIGAVGALLFFPDRRHIQHAGVGVGLGGVAANSFSMMTLSQPLTQTQHLMLNTKHDMTAVTAACMMIRKSLYDEIGGFDESFRVTYNDVDLCLRLYEKGYQNIYTPHVRLVHHESISVGLPEELKKRDTKEMQAAMESFTDRWKNYVEHDPNINPNFDKTNAFYDIEYSINEEKLKD